MHPVDASASDVGPPEPIGTAGANSDSPADHNDYSTTSPPSGTAALSDYSVASCPTSSSSAPALGAPTHLVDSSVSADVGAAGSLLNAHASASSVSTSSDATLTSDSDPHSCDVNSPRVVVPKSAADVGCRHRDHEDAELGVGDSRKPPSVSVVHACPPSPSSGNPASVSVGSVLDSAVGPRDPAAGVRGPASSSALSPGDDLSIPDAMAGAKDGTRASADSATCTTAGDGSVDVSQPHHAPPASSTSAPPPACELSSASKPAHGTDRLRKRTRLRKSAPQTPLSSAAVTPPAKRVVGATGRSARVPKLKGGKSKPKRRKPKPINTTSRSHRPCSPATAGPPSRRESH